MTNQVAKPPNHGETAPLQVHDPDPCAAGPCEDRGLQPLDELAHGHQCLPMPLGALGAGSVGRVAYDWDGLTMRNHHEPHHEHQLTSINLTSS